MNCMALVPTRAESLYASIYMKNNKNNEIKVAKLLTYGGQVIDPTAYI